MTRLRGALRRTLIALLALVLLFEEWGWEPLASLLARFAKLPLVGLLERRIARLPPAGALAIFALPVLALFPIKLLALFLMGRGHVLPGLTVLLAAKVLGTAIVARLFILTQPSLMTLPWFARWYPRWKAWKDGVMAQVRASASWQLMADWRARSRAWWRSLL